MANPPVPCPSPWTPERHAAARESSCAWCAGYLPDSLDRIERLEKALRYADAEIERWADGESGHVLSDAQSVIREVLNG